ncbi:MAG TPA: 4-alpha-glucanotransferase [Chloroflexia bacterium]|nr:4-alpha-glucanotransferase [Chloroflexia bacterium]
MEFERAGGILVHPTSFPGPYGVGDLGPEAYRFVDFLHETNQKLWQILPLNPTGYGDSPYAAYSAFAGNPLLISPDLLVLDGLLDEQDLAHKPDFPEERVDYGQVYDWKMPLLTRSFQHFQAKGGHDHIKVEFERFRHDRSGWLDDYALFRAAKETHGGVAWSEWEPALVRREEEALLAWHERLAEQVAFQKYIQFLFFRQWLHLKKYANERGIKIIGDMPIFVAYDSADVWANQDLFYLDENGQPTVVAGTPPDFFSETGQYWGNPLYRWEKLSENGYAWWVERFRASFEVMDILRIDHFRGFEAYWEIPVNSEGTAVNGQWVKGPGMDLFEAVRTALGEQPIMAEDLDTITREVDALREEAGFPGMRVLLFAFGGPELDPKNPYLLHNYEPDTVVYTGNHDTDTAAGWYASLDHQEKQNLLRYLDPLGTNHHLHNLNPAEMAWKLVEVAWSSVARLAVVPLQDIMGLGSESRMNFPGKGEGNWGWRYKSDHLHNHQMRERLVTLTHVFRR